MAKEGESMDRQNVIDLFYAHKNDMEAIKMARYMKNHFPFLGLPSPLRKKLSRAFLKESQKEELDFSFVDDCYYREEREFQYLAIDYLLACRKQLKPEDLDQIKQLIMTKSWWDSSDAIDDVVGYMILTYPKLKRDMVNWSKDENIWVKRVAIDFQLKYKDKTDCQLLETIILNSVGTNEFFINKAIGWALREYSKTDKEWVQAFINKHQDVLSSLSLREGKKYL